MNLGSASVFRTVILIVCFGQRSSRIVNNSVDFSDRNSDIYLNTIQLVTKYGYTPQIHTVITKDGYLVNLFRIQREGPPVILVHGVGDSSDSWLVLGPSNSIAYILADAGYDVWIYNARGNKYSKGHVKNLPEQRYWDFSFEEMGTQDMPAVVDYILTSTFQEKLSYIGFSQGTTIFLIMCSIMPEYNDKIKEAVLLAPVGTISYTKYPFIDIIGKNLALVKLFFDTIGVYEVFSPNALQNLYHAKVCQQGVPVQVFCALEYFISYGIRNVSNLLPEKLPVLASHIPAGVSTKTFAHYFQVHNVRSFRRYDYGIKGNLARYKRPIPPAYDLSLVSAPLYIFVSESDWFSTIQDVEPLRDQLPNIKKFVVFNESLDFTHLEFVYGSRINTFVNEPVIGILRDNYDNSVK